MKISGPVLAMACGTVLVVAGLSSSPSSSGIEKRLAEQTLRLDAMARSHEETLTSLVRLTGELREEHEWIQALHLRLAALEAQPDASWLPAVRELQGQLRSLEHLGCWKWGP